MFALALGLSMTVPARLSAQGCHTIDPPCPGNEAPHVVISPSGGSYTSASLPITVYLTDDGAMDTTSLTFAPSVTLTGSSWAPGHSSGTVTGTLTLSSGTDTLIVRIADDSSVYGADTVVFTYTPPPPPPAQDSATLSLSPYSSTVRSVSGCSGCFYGAAGYATPAYISRDTPRSVALVYSSATAVPMGFVQLDATVNSTTVPNYISLELLKSGTPVTLTNGGNIAYFTGDTGTVRLGARFDASGDTTGFYDYVARVKVLYGGTTKTSQIPVRVLIINNRTNVTGAGWSIAGLAQLWKTSSSDSSVAITDGSGDIVFFQKTGGTFVTPAGDFTTLTLSGSVYTRTASDGSWARFNSAGYLTATGTRFSDSTRYAYDGSNRISSITDEAGKTTTFTYAPNASCLSGAASGTLCAITTPGSRVSKFVVNSSTNDLLQIQDPDIVTAFTGTYSAHELVSATDRLGGVTRLTYDAFLALASVTTPAVTTTTTGGSTATDSATTTFQSIEKALLATGNTSAGSARGFVKADTAYAKITAPNGTVTKMVLAGPGEPTKLVVQPLAGPTQTTTVQYNANYLPTSVTTTPVGGTTTYDWTSNQLFSTIDPHGVRTDIYRESTYSQPREVRVNGELQYKNFYSGTLVTLDSTVAGSDIRATPDTTAPRTTYTWDTHGRPTQMKDRQNHTTSISYDATGFQNTHQVSVGSNTTSFTYDKYGRDSVATDPLSHATTRVYDVLNRLISSTQPGPASTAISFTRNTTAHTLTTTVTDPRSLTFTTVANALGLATAVTDPQAHTASAGYDRNGFLRRAVSRAGDVVTFDYDSLGRPTTRTAGADVTSYTYDGATSPTDPHWAVAANAASRDSVATDAQGHVTAVTSKHGAVTVTQTMTYDGTGQRKVLRVTNGSWTDSVVFVNDTIQYPLQLPDFGGNWTQVRYTSAGPVDSLRYPTGGSTTRLLIHPTSYTDRQEPQEVDVDVGTTRHQKWTYSYDQLGRITYADSGYDRDYIQRHYTYDARNRLASYSDVHTYADSVQEDCPDHQITCDPPPPWDLTWHNVTLRSATYSPDNSGNRTDGSASLSNDRLSSMTGADGRSYSFTYDDAGRVLSKTASGYSQTYGWNALGELAWVKTGTDSVAYGYDAAGRRVRKWDSQTSATTYYVWDGTQLLMQLDGSGNRTFEYSYQAGIDAPVAVKASGSTMYYYQLDQSGNVAAVWNTSNSIVARYTYDPYGYLVASSGSLTQPLRWKGREYDSETGLYYMRARYYDPTVGRFISEDPAGLGGGINPYTYADGDPVNGSDPMGLHGCNPGVVGVTVTIDGKEWCNTMVAQLPTVVATAEPNFLDPYTDHPGPAVPEGPGVGSTPGTGRTPPARKSGKDCLGEAWDEEKGSIITDGADLTVSIFAPELSEATTAVDVGKAVVGVMSPLVVSAAQLTNGGVTHDGVAIGAAIASAPYHTFESAAEVLGWKFLKGLPIISIGVSGTLLIRDLIKGTRTYLNCRDGGE